MTHIISPNVYPTAGRALVLWWDDERDRPSLPTSFGHGDLTRTNFESGHVVIACDPDMVELVEHAWKILEDVRVALCEAVMDHPGSEMFRAKEPCDNPTGWENRMDETCPSCGWWNNEHPAWNQTKEH